MFVVKHRPRHNPQSPAKPLNGTLWLTMAQELKTPASIPPDLRQRLMECSPWTWKYRDMEIQPCVGTRAGLPPSTWSVPIFIGKTGQGQPKNHQNHQNHQNQTNHSSRQPPRRPIPHSQFQIPPLTPAHGQPPRHPKPGREGRANPTITKIKRITVQDNPPLPIPHSALPIPHSPPPPPLTPPAATAYTPCWFPCDTPAVPLRHSHTPVALPRSGPVVGAASAILSRSRPDYGPILSRIYPGVLV